MKPTKNLFLILFVLALTIASVAQAKELKEPKTGVSFPQEITYEDQKLFITGTGIRTKAIFKVYAAAMYVTPDIKDELSSKNLNFDEPTQETYEAILDSNAGKLLVTHFVRNVEAWRVVDAFKSGLQQNYKASTEAAQADIKKFLDASNVDIKKDQQFRIYVQGEKVIVLPPGKPALTIENKDLGRAVVAMWIGPHPPSEDFKKSIISVMGKMM